VSWPYVGPAAALFLSVGKACRSARPGPGETLHYHKHDHPSSTDAATTPRGYQWHGSFPVETVQFGIVIEHSFDFGDARAGVSGSSTQGAATAATSPY
jgi:hypothetical protein